MTLKTTIYAACLLLAGCAVPKKVAVTDPAVIRALPQPVMIFGIGYWGRDHMVLTLVDGRHEYLTVMIRRDDRLKTGTIYAP
jgi:uncharacterized lipoprotein YajG